MKINKKILLLKYLDNELTIRERENVERLLESDEEMRVQLKEIRTKKQIMLRQLIQLRPEEDIMIPEWEKNRLRGTLQTKPAYKVLKWAAILMIPVVVYFILHEMREPVLSDAGNLKTEDQREIILTLQRDIDWAISPNRSWTHKQLVQTETITKTL